MEAEGATIQGDGNAEEENDDNLQSSPQADRR